MINASIFPIISMKKTKPMIASIVKEQVYEKQMNKKQNVLRSLKERV